MLFNLSLVASFSQEVGSIYKTPQEIHSQMQALNKLHNRDRTCVTHVHTQWRFYCHMCIHIAINFGGRILFTDATI